MFFLRETIVLSTDYGISDPSILSTSVVDKEAPDVVIQEIVGRHLYNFTPSPELVPDH